MKINGLGMYPFNTTRMGVVKGALDYYGFEYSIPTAFGASGHAFLINIHEQICPSGPYCWEHSKTSLLLRNLGLQMREVGWFSPKNSKDDREGVEKKLRNALDAGMPCAFLNLENQLITGYDEVGFDVIQPWGPKAGITPARLSFGSWKELGEEIHIVYYVITKVEASDRLHTILDSLDYALDLYKNAPAHSWPGYKVGPDAYVNWINATPEFGSSHGNWWNAMVWSECRAMASQYMVEIGQEYPPASRIATRLQKAYLEISQALNTLSDKSMDSQQKIALLKSTQEKEAAATAMLADLVTLLRIV